MNTGKPVTFLFLLGAIFLSLACTELITPGGTADFNQPGPTQDVEATVQAAVSGTLQAIVNSAQGQTIPEPQPTIGVGLEATITALLATRPAAVFPTPSQPLDPLAETPESPATELPPTPTQATAIEFPPTSVPQATALPAPTATLAIQPTATPAPAASCTTAPQGTLVAALIFGQQVADSSVENGSYILLVEQPEGGNFDGKMVTFKVDGINASQSGIWRQGGADIIDLTVTPIPAPQPTPQGAASAPTQTRGIGPLAQPLRPHVFVGTASICAPP